MWRRVIMTGMERQILDRLNEMLTDKLKQFLIICQAGILIFSRREIRSACEIFQIVIPWNNDTYPLHSTFTPLILAFFRQKHSPICISFCCLLTIGKRSIRKHRYVFTQLSHWFKILAIYRLVLLREIEKILNNL